MARRGTPSRSVNSTCAAGGWSNPRGIGTQRRASQPHNHNPRVAAKHIAMMRATADPQILRARLGVSRRPFGLAEAGALIVSIVGLLRFESALVRTACQKLAFGQSEAVRSIHLFGFGGW